MQVFLGSKRRVFDVSDWTIEFRAGNQIRCRPSLNTWLRRLSWSFLLGLFAAGAYLVSVSSPQDFLEARLMRGFALLFGVAGALAPSSLLWQRVDLYRDPKKLIVKSIKWIPGTLILPVANFRSITILANETRMARWALNLGAGWRWRVLLFGEHGGVDMRVDYQRERPEEKQVPVRVAEFVRYLQQLVPLPYQGPQIVEWGAGRAGAYHTG